MQKRGLYKLLMGRSDKIFFAYKTLTWKNFTHLAPTITSILLHLGTVVLVAICELVALMMSRLNGSHLVHLILMMLLIGALSLIRKDILIIATGRSLSNPTFMMRVLFLLLLLMLLLLMLLILMLMKAVTVVAPREFYGLELNHLSSALVTLGAQTSIQTCYFRSLSIATLSLM